MAGENGDREESMDGSDDNGDIVESAEPSDCDEMDLGDMEYYDDSNEYCSVHKNLKDDIRKALAAYPDSEEELGIPSVQIDETRTNFKYISSVVLTFTLKDISEHLLTLWDLTDTPAILMEMDNIHRGDFRTYGQLPTITVRKHSSEGHFLVGEQLKNFALRLCRESFSLRVNESPEAVGSFFGLVYGRVKERLVRLSEYCVTCGEVLSGGGVLPSICDRDLCMYQYSELHLFDGLSVPRVSPDVLSLLLFAFGNANVSPRRKDILTPAPPIKDVAGLLTEAKGKRLEKWGPYVEPCTSPSEQAFQFSNGFHELRGGEAKGSAYWNHTVVMATPRESGSFSEHSYFSVEPATFAVLLENLPCPREFLASVTSYHAFRNSWPHMANVVDWLVISNRSYLEMVPKPMNVDFLHTSSQYCFISDTPAKQAEFDQLKAAYGGTTRFFFHGSPLENWHSIIRSGLRNMSGTKYQLVGAAYGKGIYLSPFLDFALGYANRSTSAAYLRRHGGMSMTSDRPIRSDCKRTVCCETERMEDFACVALVEVIDCPEAYIEKTDEIFVVEEEKWCSIRMLLLYRPSDITKLHDQMRKAWHKSSVIPAAPGSRVHSSSGYQSGIPASSLLSGMGGTAGHLFNRLSALAGASSSTSSSVQADPNQQNQSSHQKTRASLEELRERVEKYKAMSKDKLEQLKREKERQFGEAKTGETSKKSPSDEIVNLSKEEEGKKEEDTDIIELRDDDEMPGTSGTQKDNDRQGRERLKLAVGEEKQKKPAEKINEWMGMSEAWMKKREKKMTKNFKNMSDEIKKDKKEKKKEKDPAKRKRAMSDPNFDVPKKSSSPRNELADEKPVDADVKMDEGGGNGEDDELAVLEIRIAKDKKKKKKANKTDKKEENDDTDEDVEVLFEREGKSGNGKNKKELNDDLDDVLVYVKAESLKMQKEKEKKDKRKAIDESKKDGTTSQAVSNSSTSPFVDPASAPVQQSANTSTAMTQSPLVLAPPLPPPLAPPLPPSPNMRQLAAASNAATAHAHYLAVMAKQHAITRKYMIATQSTAAVPHPPGSTSGSLIRSTTMPAVTGAAPPGSQSSQMLSLGATMPSIAPAFFPGFQSASGMMPRRSRRRGATADGSPFPGDLTVITDEQREQIARVVRMFRNSGFEERVNRHLNRDEDENEVTKKDEENGGVGLRADLD